MQVSVETTEGLERKLTVEIPAEQIDGEVKKRIADTAKKVRLDGFRPGKVPVKVVKQRFGASLRAEVVSEVASQSFQQAVVQEDLKPVGQPTIEPQNNEEGEDFKFVATFEVYPEFELADLSGLTIEKLSAEVTDGDVSNMVDKLVDQQATWNEVDRVAAKSDRVNIDYQGTKDGEVFDGGSAENTDLELGSAKMIEGFESGLEGAKAGEERMLKLTFPKDYPSEDLQGSAVEFTVTINSVSEKVLAELNDEFFAKFDIDEGGLEAFKESIRKNMVKQLADAVENNTKTQVMDGLSELNEIDLPAAMISDEVNTLRQQSLSQFGESAENFDLSLLPAELFEEQAHRRVALGLILGKTVEQYEIKPDREQVIEFIDDIASSYDDPEEVKSLYLGDESRMQQVQLIVMEGLVVDKVLEMAQVTEKDCTYDEAIKGPEV